MKWAPAFLRSEARAGGRQLLLYLICVVCAVMAVACVGGWRATVDIALAADARSNAGGDVVAFATVAFSPALQEALAPYHGVATAEMFTVALGSGGKALFCKLKAVEPGYPLYGNVPLASGRDLQQALLEGWVVEQRVLERLGLKVGDSLKIGERTLPIVDVSLSEPDRPLGMFGVSPRIFVAYRDLDSLALLRRGSYAEYRVHIRLADPDQAAEVATGLRQTAIPDQERVETWQRPPVSMRRFVDNFFTFLDLMAAFAVVLGGLGMQGTLTAWLRQRSSAIAVVRTLGARADFVVRHYAVVVALVTLPGIVLGLCGAALALWLSGDWLASLLPVRAVPHLTLASTANSLLLSGLVSVGFTLQPLARLRAVRPATLLRREDAPSSRKAFLLLSLALLATTFGLLWVTLHNWRRAGQFSLGLAALLLVIWGLADLALRLARSWRPRNLALRVGLRGLLGPASAARPIATILAAALTVLFTVVLVERALDAAWIEALPPDAPNLVFFDIQPDQAREFLQVLGLKVRLYPSLRARIRDVDGQPLPRQAPREYWDHDARREFRCSAREDLEPDEILSQGAALFSAQDGPAQVSASDKVAELAHLRLGSRITFTIQGVPLEARVSSIRHEVHSHFRPSFDFIFSPSLIADAPQTIYAAARVEEAQVGAIQTRVAQALPSVTSMDVSETIRLVAVRLTRMVGLIRFFLVGGGLAGLVILVSAALATRLARMRESAYYKVLGATRGFVSRTLLWENTLLGLLCSSLALTLAVLVSWGLCRWELDIEFSCLWGTWAAMLLVPTVLIAIIGWGVSRSVIEARPAPFLREDA